MEIQILNLLNNWPKHILQDYLDYSNPEEMTEEEKYNNIGSIIKTFKFNENIHNSKEISSYLFNLLKNNEKSWKNKSRCLYCFDTNIEFIEMTEDINFIKCLTCNKLYEYTYNWDNIPLPNEKFIFITDENDNSILYNNSFNIKITDIINFKKFDYFNLETSFFHKLTERILKEGIPNITFSKEIKQKNIKVYYFPDFFHLIDKFDVPDKIKNSMTKLFWNINFSDYKKIYNDILNDKNESFIEFNNETLDNFKQINKKRDLEIEFNKINKIDKSKLKNIKKVFNKINIFKRGNDIKFINLLNIFHQFELTNEIPFCSLFISKLDIYKNKVLRSFPQDIYKEWMINYYKFYHLIDKSLIFKIKFLEEIYITLKIYDDGTIKLLIPQTTEYITKKDINTLFKKINENIINKIKKLYYKEKIQEIKEIENLNTEITDLTDLNLNFVISFDTIFKINIEKFYRILLIFSDYLIIEKYLDNSIFLNYIFELENKQELQYRFWLNNNIKKFIKYGEKQKFLDITLLKSTFAINFDLDKTYVDIILNKWEEENRKQIELFIDGKINLQKFSQLNFGTIIKLFFDDKFLRIHLYGISKWNDKKKIVDFLKKILYLYENIDNIDYFKSKINKKNIKIDTEKKEKDLKLSLRRFLPEIFWEPEKSNPDDKGFTRYCQKKEQPLIFSDKFDYQEYIKQNEIKEQTPIQRDFSLDIESKTNKELDEKLLKIEVNSKNLNKDLKNILLMQKLIEINENIYTNKELIEITNNLGLSTIYKRNIMIRNINRFLNLQIELNKIGKLVYPRPNTFIINKNQQDYYIVCPGTDKERKFIGFLDVEKHPKFSDAPNNEKSNFCVPCCKKTFNDTNIDFCTGTIDYNEYINNLTTKTDYIKNEKKIPLEINRYGFLNKNLHKLFNNNLKKENLLSEFKTPIFLRYGINNTNTFIYSIMECLGIKKIEFFKKLLLENLTLNIYKTLNNGNLYFKYSFETFKNLILTDILSLNYLDLWELVSIENFIDKNGFNIIIFENKIINNVEKLYLVCPENQEINYFFKPQKKTIFLIKTNDIFEPIIKYISLKKQEKLFLVNNDTFKSINELYLESCQIIGLPELTLKNLYLKFGNQIKYQYLNEFNKIQYILVNDIILPIIPCGPIRELTFKNILDIKFTSFDKTIKFILENLQVNIKIFIKENFIIYIILNDFLIIPVIKRKITPNDKIDFKIIDKFINYIEIDENILKKIDENLFNETNITLTERELYEIFKMLFAEFLTEKEIKFMKEKVDENFENNIIDNFIKNKINLIDIVKFDELVKFFKIKNIRTLNNNIFITNGKINLYKKKMLIFIKKLKYELFKLLTKRNIILNKTFNIIIDDLNFVSTKNYIFL